MLFSKDFLFIHVPKTGGMSITRWLLNNYMGDMYLCIPDSSREHAIGMFGYPDVEPRVRFITGRRHETLAEAGAVVREFGMELSSFKTIAAVTRHPLELERSYHAHLRKPHIVRREGESGAEIELANWLDLASFVELAPFCYSYPARVEDYFEIDGMMPVNFEIVRMENLAADLNRVFGPFLAKRYELPQVNKTNYPHQMEEAEISSDQLTAALVRKHPFLSRLYGVNAPDTGQSPPVRSVVDFEDTGDGHPVNGPALLKAVRAIFSNILDTLESSNDVTIPRFGRFVRKQGKDGIARVIFEPRKDSRE